MDQALSDWISVLQARNAPAQAVTLLCCVLWALSANDFLSAIEPQSDNDRAFIYRLQLS